MGIQAFCSHFPKHAKLLSKSLRDMNRYDQRNYQRLHWSCAKWNCAYTQNLSHTHTHSSRILGFFVADQRHLLELWGGWSSCLEAAVPVKTHSGGTAHLGGHASHANLAQFAHWGQTRTRGLWNNLQLANMNIYRHTNTHYSQSFTQKLSAPKHTTNFSKQISTVCRKLKEPWHNTFLACPEIISHTKLLKQSKVSAMFVVLVSAW